MKIFTKKRPRTWRFQEQFCQNVVFVPFPGGVVNMNTAENEPTNAKAELEAKMAPRAIERPFTGGS